MRPYRGRGVELFEIDTAKILSTIREEGYTLVGLELPEGLRDKAAEIMDEIKTKTGCEVVVSSNPCYGACDIDDEALARLGCEAVFHLGHERLLGKTRIPVYHIRVKMTANPVPLIKEGLEKLRGRVGLLTTAQHLHQLGRVKEYLEKEGFEVLIGSPKGRTRFPGHVLGCSFAPARAIADEVDVFAFIGSGVFHPLGVALATGKKTISFDVETGVVKDMDELREHVLRQRFAQIGRARDAVSFGVIIGEKAGQRRRKLALKILDKLKKQGKKAYLISLREITPENLYSFRKLDALVSTACPRIAIDDVRRYSQPMLTPLELEIVLGEREWSEYAFDEIA
jgi:2-(3-amino-3-carboxypropyl)histidine synthase